MNSTETVWVPNGAKRPWQIGLLTSVTYRRKSPAQRMQEDSRSIKFLTSQSGVLFLNLILGDFAHCIGLFVTYKWIAIGAMPAPANALCRMQAVTLQMGNILSAFANSWIAIHSLLLVVFSYKMPWRVIWCFVATEWSVTTVLAVVGPLHIAKGGPEFYGIAGSYCWIAQPYAKWRIYLHHAFVIAAAGLCLLLYSITAVWIVTARRRAQGCSATAYRVAKIMMLYPVAYIITVIPLATYRLAALAGDIWPIQVGLCAGIVIALSGAINCIIYGLTRSVITIPAPSKFFSAAGPTATQSVHGRLAMRHSDVNGSGRLLSCQNLFVGGGGSSIHTHDKGESRRSSSDPSEHEELKDPGQMV
ncbi:hypothetical protein OIO90_001314 [Microbotryomycetes sp. JL221]|nr:hypothetical protein OIO90_001314 [Microbotryomycetes sp. JL221]